MIKKGINLYKNNDLVRDNVILFISTLILNIFGFLFHFYLGRALGPKDYGILGVLLAFSYFLNVFLQSLQSTFAKFVAEYDSQNSFGKICYAFRRALRKLFIIGIILAFVFILLVPYIGKFLHITDLNLLYLLTILIISTLLLAVVRGVMQGLQKFKVLGLNLTLEGIVKFFGAVLFVSLGWKIYGAIFAFVLSLTLGVIFGILALRKYLLWENCEFFETKEIYKYSFPVLFMILFLTAFFSLDIMLVKHYFSEVDAGLYSALSILGKIIFFGSVSISQVMFPKVSALIAKGKKHKTLYFKSLGAFLLMVIPLMILYLVFPRSIINIVFGNEYLGLVPVLGVFAIFIVLFGVVYLSSFYLVAQKKYRFIPLLFLFNLLEIIGISYFHSSLLQVVYVLIGVMACLSILLLVYILNKNES